MTMSNARSVSTSNLKRKGKGDKAAVVPEAEFRSYYGRPIVKPPAWKWEVPVYFFVGGMSGASAILTAGARLAGHERLSDRARLVTCASAMLGPPLLIADLHVPSRFHHMLRVFKPTSPLSVGSWVLATFAPAAVGSWLLHRTASLPRVQRTAETTAAALGPVMSTYTAVLVANTSTPIWHEARHELPSVFAASSAASAGAAALLLAGSEPAEPARRLALAGAAGELAATTVMEQRLGELAEPYHVGRSGMLAKAAKASTGGGAILVGAGKRRPALAKLGAWLLLAGSMLQRWAVFEAGKVSARDPKYTVMPQRRRIEGSDGAGQAGGAS
jgi:hypothetical protein